MSTLDNLKSIIVSEKEGLSSNLKKPNVFFLGIISGGVAILYIALALSFFKFGILGIYPALAFSVLITSGVFILSQKYNSQTILALAIIGGYLPIFSIIIRKKLLYGAMIYLVILNIVALIISVNRKWTVTSYIGFILNVAGAIYVSNIIFFGILYLVFYIADLWEFSDLLAIDFAIVYLTLGKFVEKFMEKEQKVRALFYITGLAFIMLIIPFQFHT